MKTALSMIEPLTNLVMPMGVCVSMYANGGLKRLCMVKCKDMLPSITFVTVRSFTTKQVFKMCKKTF